MSSGCARQLNRSIAVLLLASASGCAAPVANDEEQGPLATKVEPQSEKDGEIVTAKSALNAACTSLAVYPILNAVQNGQALGAADTITGPIQFTGYCFQGGDQVLVWATDYLTGQMVYDYMWAPAWPDAFYGIVTGSLPGTCSPAQWVQLHAIDFGLGKRYDTTLYHLRCP
jgi:hypothetical protein